MKSPLNRGGLRFYLVLLCLVAGTWFARATTPRSIIAGMPLLLLGVCLHTWAKGCLRQNRTVATIGPYRFVRHPFYLANALIDAALVVMSGYAPLAILLPLWWLAVYVPVIRGEERYLCEKFPDEYPAFRRRVPCLLPWHRPLPFSGEGFRWDNPNIAGGEELPRAVRILAYPLLFLAAAGLRARGQDWLRDDWSLTAMTGLASVYLFAWQLERHQRRRTFILPSWLQPPIFRVIAAALALAAVWRLAGSNPRAATVGGGLLLLGAAVYSRRPARAMLAEMLALLGAAIAGGLMWLAPPIAALYAAWVLDSVLAAGQPLSARSSWPYFYPLLAIACALVIGARFVVFR